jgi:peptidyl-prolyl cis-trans isomerase D
LDLIALTYSSIADSTIKVEEGDLKSYFNKNADKYKEKETSRKLEYVLFDVTPSAEDTASIQKWVSDQLTQFAAAKNDTLYVDLNSDTKFDTMAKRLNMFPENVQQQLFSQPVGSIVGPVYENGKFSIYKIAGIKEDSLWQMRASHILFKTDGPTKQDTLNTMKKANEVMAEIRKGTKTFADAAQQYGTDGTASRGGDLGWFVEGQMVKEFNDAVKAGKKGDMRIVKTQFGIHILKITEDKSRKLVCAGVLERKIEPGEKTTNLAFNMASQFAASSQSEEDFDKNITEKAYTKQTADVVREADKQISGMQEAREVVRWAFNAKKGEVSDVFAIGDKYMVAKLAAIREKDKADFDASKLKAEIEYRKEKKAEQLIEKANTAMTGASDMQTISNKLQVPVTPTTGLTFENANIAYVGADNTFTGTLFGATVNGKISGPVKGDQAVYLFKLNKFNDAPAIADFSAFKIELLGNLSQRMEYGAMEVLKEINNVKDNRAKFY